MTDPTDRRIAPPDPANYRKHTAFGECVDSDALGSAYLVWWLNRNTTDAAEEAAPTPVQTAGAREQHISRDALKRRIENEPDLPTEAGLGTPQLWNRVPEVPPQELAFVGADLNSIQYAMYRGKYYTLNHAECVISLLAAVAAASVPVQPERERCRMIAGRLADSLAGKNWPKWTTSQVCRLVIAIAYDIEGVGRPEVNDVLTKIHAELWEAERGRTAPAREGK